MLAIDKHPDRSKLRWFAALWFPAFLAVVGTAAWRWGAPHSVVIGAWLVGGAVSLVALVLPAVIRPVFVGLSYATFPIGFVVSMTILAILYFVIVTPIALVMRLFGRDTMQRKLEPTAQSYWRPIPERTDASTYFRQS
jgi:hypothetical protein